MTVSMVVLPFGHPLRDGIHASGAGAPLYALRWPRGARSSQFCDRPLREPSDDPPSYKRQNRAPYLVMDSFYRARILSCTAAAPRMRPTEKEKGHVDIA